MKALDLIKANFNIIMFILVECQQNEKHPYGISGYLLMEYFPLGGITTQLKKFQPNRKHDCLKSLSQLSEEIQEVESSMLESVSNDKFGEFKHQWCSLKRQKEKVTAWCKCIIQGVMETIKRLHANNLIHLDVKGMYLVPYIHSLN